MNKTINAIILIGIISSFTTSSLYADPVHLDCKVTNKEGEARSFSLKLDEASNKITHTELDGAFIAEGIFSANEINYDEILLRGTSTVYSIDRTSLDIVIRYFIMPGSNSMHELEGMAYKGSCKIIEIKDRKI